MRTISIMNVKGGTGKTATAVNLAAILAVEQSKRVLVVDVDPQGDATYMLAPDYDMEAQTGAYGLLSLGEDPEAGVFETAFRGLDLVGGSPDLIYLSMDSSQRVTGAMETLRIWARSVGRYDYMIVDCPPAFCASTVAALAESDLVLIPVALDALSMRGCQLLTTQLETIHDISPSCCDVAILPTMWHNCEVCKQALDALVDMELPVLPVKIRRTDKVPESTFYRLPLIEYSRTSAAGVDYRQLAQMAMIHTGKAVQHG